MNKIYLFVLSLVLYQSPLMAEIVERAIKYKHDGDTLKGYLVYDDALTDKRPGIMVVHEWVGLNAYPRKRARMLAEEGYVAFAADMYGEGKVTEDSKQAKEWMEEITADVEGWRERAALGLEQLINSEKVNPELIGAIGYCFGGATVLQMSYAGTKAKGVVSFHGGLPAAPDEVKGKIKNKILAFHGAADSFIAPEVVRNFQNKLQQSGADWEFVTFGGNVRHGFTNKDVDRAGVENLKYDARADLRSWASMKAFFRDLFSQ